MAITRDSAAAASMWVSGVIRAEATAVFIARRRNVPLNCEKRPACAAWAPCRRTTRAASTFSSTT